MHVASLCLSLGGLSDWLQHLIRITGSTGAYFLLAGGVVLLFVVSAALHLAWWRRQLTLALGYEAVESIDTADGSRIELRRIAPAEPSALPPVLLVHGVASNHRNQDGDPDHSLARYLKARGRDVWLVTLRSGLRLRPTLRRKTCFANMARYDLPLAISAVLDRTGAPQLDYVGFSMGGILLYATLGREVPQRSIRRAAFVGAPGRIDSPVRVPRFIGSIPRSLMPTLPLRTLAIAYAFQSEWFATPLHHAILNPKNMERGMTRRGLVNCIEDVASALHADFLGWASRGGTIEIGGKPILRGLEDASVPALFIAGSADRIAPPATVRHAFEAWGASNPGVFKRFVVLGEDRKGGYGHGDLALGADVSRDVYPPIEQFLASDDPRATLPLQQQ